MNSKELEKLANFKEQVEKVIEFAKRAENKENNEFAKNFWLGLEQYIEEKSNKAVKDAINYVEKTKQDKETHGE